MSSWINKILLIAWSNILLCYLKRSSSRRKKQNKLRKITRKQFSWKKIYWAERRFEKERYENASTSKKKDPQDMLRMKDKQAITSLGAIFFDGQKFDKKVSSELNTSKMKVPELESSIPSETFAFTLKLQSIVASKDKEEECKFWLCSFVLILLL